MKKILIFLSFLILIYTTQCPAASINDFIVSKGGLGPYALSNTYPANLKVFLGNSEMLSSDYIVDPENASITFLTFIDKGVVVKVDYDRSEKSVPSPKRLNYMLLSNEQRAGNFNINVFYEGDKTVSGMALSTGTYLAGGVISTDIALDTNGDISKINLDEVAGKIGYIRDFGKIKLGATYSKAGDNISGNTGYNAGSDIVDLLLTYSENGISVSSGYTGTNNLENNQVYTNKISYTPGASTKLSFANTTEIGENTSKRSDNYALEQSFKSFYLKYNQTDNISGSSGNKNYALELFGNQFKILAKRSDILGNDTVIGRTDTASISSNPTDKLAINMTGTQTYNETSQKTGETASIGVVSKPADNMQIETLGSYTENSAGDKSLDAGAKIKYTPSDKLGVTVEGGKNFSTENENIGLGIVSKVSDNLSVQTSGKYSDTDLKRLDTDSTVKYTLGQKLGLSSNIKTQSKSGGRTLHQTDTALTYNPTGNISLSTGFKDTEISETDYMRTARISAASNFAYMSISALYIDRYLKTGELPDSKAVSISLRPMKTVTISTSYAENPENTDGTYKNEIHKAASVEWVIGTFTLTSGMNQIYTGLADPKTSARFGLKSLLWGGSSLSAGISMEGSMGDYFSGTRAYSLDYLLDVSKDTYIKVGGVYYERNDTEADRSFKKDNVTASATVGIKF